MHRSQPLDVAKVPVRKLAWIVISLAFLMLPSPSMAQSVGGRVTDSSGSVLPGVSVEATSPVLTEGVRQVVTDGEGRYLLTGLRSGEYQVTFSLSGFGTIKREGIELVSGFTAPLNVEMGLATVNETVTVSGASPIVDVQNVRTQAVTTREVLDAVPSGKTVEAFGRLIPGSGSTVGGGNAFSPDVGGSQAMQQVPLAFRGNSNTIQTVDGFRQSIATAPQFSGDYINNGMVQEITYTTSGDSAEAIGGGMKVNVVPKDGGNNFAGTMYGDYAYSGFSANNIDATLNAQGLPIGSTVKKTWDLNPSFGGPIMRGKLWFQATYRNYGTDKIVPGSYSEVTGEPGQDNGYINSGVLRVTWQADSKNKFSAMYTRPPKYRSSWGIAAQVSPEAAAIRKDPMIYHGIVKWTSTLTNKLLATAGAGFYDQQYTTYYEPQQVTQPGQVHTFPVTGAAFDPFYPNVDSGTGWTVGSYAGGNVATYNQLFNYIGSLSYVTGSHAVKAGFDISQIQGRQGDSYRGDIQFTWINGKPNSVTLRASPRYTTENLLDTGVYVQDVWTVKRVTVNGGLRYEGYLGNVPELYSPAGTWVPARLTPAVHGAPDWKDISPRVGVAWDIAGNGKTALKFSVGRYVAEPMTSAVQPYDPMRNIVYTATAKWNSDFAEDNITLGLAQ